MPVNGPYLRELSARVLTRLDTVPPGYALCLRSALTPRQLYSRLAWAIRRQRPGVEIRTDMRQNCLVLIPSTAERDR